MPGKCLEFDSTTFLSLKYIDMRKLNKYCKHIIGNTYKSNVKQNLSNILFMCAAFCIQYLNTNT